MDGKPATQTDQKYNVINSAPDIGVLHVAGQDNVGDWNPPYEKHTDID
jgi:hypothetical protein